MTEQSILRISSVAEAAKVLDYFNGFHDGFMKRINIISSDEIDKDHGQSCSGLFEVEIDFAHYDYPSGDAPFHPHNQIVHARFSKVQDIFSDFREGFLGTQSSACRSRPRTAERAAPHPLSRASACT